MRPRGPQNRTVRIAVLTSLLVLSPLSAVIAQPIPEAVEQRLVETLRYRVDGPPLREDALRTRFDRVEREVTAARAAGARPLADVGAWRRIFDAARRFGPAAEHGIEPGVIATPPFAGYSLRVPASYDPAVPTPLVICLHGEQQPTGRAYLRHAWADARVCDLAILLAVDWPGDGQPAWSHRAHRDALFPLVYDVAFRRLNVDRDRIFLDATGPSAYEAWRIASQFADLFAGVIVRAERWVPPEDKPAELPTGNLRYLGWLQFDRTENLGPADDPSDFGKGLAQEARGLGIDPDEALVRVDPERWRQSIRSLFEWPRAPYQWLASHDETVTRVARFLKTTRRRPYPTTIDWTALDSASDARRSYWVRSLADRPGAQIRVYVDRAANRLDVQTRQVEAIEISLNDALLDLDRPVTIEVDGHVRFHGQPARSLGRMLQEIERTGDPHRVFPWVVRIELPVRTR